jgi:hypothetical protein
MMQPSASVEIEPHMRRTARPPVVRRLAPRTHASRSATGTNLLSCFGLGIAVHGDVPDLAFQFGPHVVHSGRIDLSIEVAARGPDEAGVSWQVCVRRSDGVPLLRRQMRGWTNAPPLIPPFAVLSDRVCAIPAVVLAKGRSTVALLGSPLSPRAQIALSLAYRSWRFVGTQFLVVDRRSGEVLPHLVPLELRGAATAEAPRGGLATGSWRSVRSPLSGEVLLARPESLGAVERTDARLPPPRLVALCRTGAPTLRIVARDFAVPGWPARQKSPFAGLSKLVLELPPGAGADEAADTLDGWLTGSS